MRHYIAAQWALVWVAGIIPASAPAAGPGPQSPVIQMEFVGKGVSEKIDFYYPRKVDLSKDRPAALKSAIRFDSPLYGSIDFAGRSYLVVLDEPDGKEPKLYVETRGGSGNVTPADWRHDVKARTSRGRFELAPGWTGDSLCSFKAYRFDKNDRARVGTKLALFYYSDYGLDGTIRLGGKTYRAMVIDELSAGDFRPSSVPGPGPRLLIDLDGNGKFRSNEILALNKPFNVDGNTWEVVDLTQQGTFSLRASDRTVDPLPIPEEPLDVGMKAPTFAAGALDGSTIHFPGDFKGKIVLLDFWATWCGPCMSEVPTLVAVYDELGPRGMAVLGVSLDDSDALAQVKQVIRQKKMAWRQIFDGKGWNAAVSRQYKVRSIPTQFLVDGDTGEILATGDPLRGDNLLQTVKQALARKEKNTRR